MTLRRYATLKPSRGTVIHPKLRYDVKMADYRFNAGDFGRACAGPRIDMPGGCDGRLELDHVRASGGLGMKSPTVRGNLVSLCSTHHRLKTLHGREWRPILLDYIAQRDGPAGVAE